ncbi:hypothetical protein [Schinkia azotoformans]|uniref:hypothetical protein n=1 Tax=Schinkia azotoformans TaxID=1454 RepID=UPI002DBBC634|nr:hypothetical protein [Schinkia azotoformans]MEC1772804.1 hypothetical protein [Schinkia azotoformans]MED4367477.1 hypothetical protein [Schinkia azotoformans]
MIDVAYSFEEVTNHPQVKKMVSRFKQDQQDKVKDYFYKVYIKHFNAWESDERKQQHSFKNIKKVEWNREDQCFHVFYKKTKHFRETWYHYTLDGKWY